MREVVRVSWLKPIIAGLFVLVINAVMYLQARASRESMVLTGLPVITCTAWQ